MSKSKLYDLLIIILLYIGISCLPFDLIPIANYFIILFRIVSQILLFVLLRIFLKKSPLNKDNPQPNKQIIPWFIPLIFVCFSNFFCLFCTDNTFEFSFSVILMLSIVLSVAVAFNEELIFRLILINNLDKYDKPMIKVLISSTVFGLCHITHFLSSFNPLDLITVVYTFGTGMLFGIIYVYGRSFAMAFIFHALYNVINNDLCASWIHFNGTSISYYLPNIIVAAVAILYLSVIYLFVLRKHVE